MEISSSVINYQGKQVVLSIARNITERKKVEQELSQAKNDWERTFNSVTDFIAIVDNQNQIIRANQAMAQQLGVTPEKAIGLFCYHNPPDFCPHAQTVKDGKEHSAEVYEPRLGGDFLVTTTPLKDEQGRIVGSVHVARNITERKKAEETLKKSEEEYSSLFSNMIDGFAYCQMIFDEKDEPVDFVYLQINDAFERITGLQRDLVVGKKVTQAIPGIKDANPELFEIYGRVALTGKKEKFEVFFKPLNLWLSISVYSPRKGYFAAVFEDITQRKKAEEELNLFLLAFQMSGDGIVIGDPNGNITYVNDALLKIRGSKDKNDLVGKHVLEFIAERDRPRVMQNSLECLRTGKGFVGQYAALRADGVEVQVEVATSLIENDNGEGIGFIDIIRDVSDRIKAEEALNRTMDKLVSVNEKLGVVGSLTRDDVRNKLSVITGNIYLLKKKHADCADIMVRLGEMEHACKNIVEIFDFAKMYEQIGVEELSFIDVDKTIGEAMALFSADPNVKIINECNGLTVLADSFLRQLYYNLIDNSIKHGKGVTKIRVYYETADQDKLNLIYEDNGVGVSVQDKPMLFKEGFSTAGTSGYGLYLIRKMIEAYGWTIQENGEPSKGAKFTITIPRINQKGKENFRIAS